MGICTFNILITELTHLFWKHHSAICFISVWRIIQWVFGSNVQVMIKGFTNTESLWVWWAVIMVVWAPFLISHWVNWMINYNESIVYRIIMTPVTVDLIILITKWFYSELQCWCTFVCCKESWWITVTGLWQSGWVSRSFPFLRTFWRLSMGRLSAGLVLSTAPWCLPSTPSSTSSSFTLRRSEIWC